MSEPRHPPLGCRPSPPQGGRSSPRLPSRPLSPSDPAPTATIPRRPRHRRSPPLWGRWLASQRGVPRHRRLHGLSEPGRCRTSHFIIRYRRMMKSGATAKAAYHPIHSSGRASAPPSRRRGTRPLWAAAHLPHQGGDHPRANLAPSSPRLISRRPRRSSAALATADLPPCGEDGWQARGGCLGTAVCTDQSGRRSLTSRFPSRTVDDENQLCCRGSFEPFAVLPLSEFFLTGAIKIDSRRVADQVPAPIDSHTETYSLLIEANDAHQSRSRSSPAVLGLPEDAGNQGASFARGFRARDFLSSKGRRTARDSPVGKRPKDPIWHRSFRQKHSLRQVRQRAWSLRGFRF